MGLTFVHSAYIMKVYEYAYPSNNSELCHIMANVSSYMEVVREHSMCELSAWSYYVLFYNYVNYFLHS